MKREPVALYVIRLTATLGLFLFVAMLYWSSTLVEERLREVDDELTEIKRSMALIKRDVSRKQWEKPPHPLPLPTRTAHPQEGNDNLLSPDPFYEKTIEKLLPASFEPHGLRREATIAKPENLHPLSQWAQVSEWVGLCTVSLGSLDVGKYETLSPDAALSMELKEDAEGRPEYWITLRQDIFWAPLDPKHFGTGFSLAPHFLKKHQVTAQDFQFYFDTIMNPHVDGDSATTLRGLYSDIDDVRAVDDFTLLVRWKTKDIDGVKKVKYTSKSLTASLRPFPCFVYKYFADGNKIVEDDSDPTTYRTNPVFAQNFSRHFSTNVIISCGPWLFDGMTEREIRFKRNKDFYNPYAVLVDALEMQFKDSWDNIWSDFKQEGLDDFVVPPNLMSELDRFLRSAPYRQQAKQGNRVKTLNYVTRAYSYIAWNETKPLFDSKKVRQALTMAIDRERIIRQNLNGMGIQTTGTFSPFSPSYDKSLKPYPFDPGLAKKYLREEGWTDSDGDGIIDKKIDGKIVPFRFTLTYYVKNPTTKAICDYVSTALKEVGIDCRPSGVDLADISAIFEDKGFDALMLSWSLGTPPEDPRQLWHSSGAKQKGSSNAIGFSNRQIDEIIEALDYEDDLKKRISLYHQFDKIIYDEAPYTFLYAPKATMAYRDYLQNVFIPAERQDLIPGADVAEPVSNIFWIKK